MKIKKLLEVYPFLEEFFVQNNIEVGAFKELTLEELFNQFSEEEKEDKAIDISRLMQEMEIYIENMRNFLQSENRNQVQSLTILPGYTKNGEPEQFEELCIRTSEIISIVGPTGSGKSRLLGDIEWTAQGDTPTRRRILINGVVPDTKWRLSSNNRLVAQLSQNMNFVMDLTVREFLEIHADSRMVKDKEKIICRILKEANELAGESFVENTPITSLSGGQSRALMIADTAILSTSPIVLIDEIENAGIDRERALDLLVSEDKIVLMATHDPLLALMADKRIVIRNGGIREVIHTSPEEKKLLQKLIEMDQMFQKVRQDLRSGCTLLKVT